MGHPPNNDYCARHQKGDRLASAGKHEKAIYHYDLAIRMDPPRFLRTLRQGPLPERAETARGGPLECLNEALRLEPRNAVALHLRGDCMMEAGRLEDALRCFDEALRIDPASEWAHHNRGLCMLKMDRDGEALRCFDAALRINPKNAGTHHNRGVCLAALRRYGAAIKCHNRALRLNPDLREAYHSKGQALLAGGQVQGRHKVIQQLPAPRPRERIGVLEKGPVPVCLA